MDQSTTSRYVNMDRSNVKAQHSNYSPGKTLVDFRSKHKEKTMKRGVSLLGAMLLLASVGCGSKYMINPISPLSQSDNILSQVSVVVKTDLEDVVRLR
jgi:hypothetical protein